MPKEEDRVKARRWYIGHVTTQAAVLLKTTSVDMDISVNMVQIVLRLIPGR